MKLRTRAVHCVERQAPCPEARTSKIPRRADTTAQVARPVARSAAHGLGQVA